MNRIIKLGALSLALAGSALSLAGCNIVAPVAYAIEGPPKVEAQTRLDSDRPTVIFVDDRSNEIPRRSLRVIIGQEAEETLIAERVIEQENMIAAQSTLRAAMAEPADTPMSVADIGLAVGADVVIYLTVDAWTLSRDGVSYSPVVAGRVKVIDAAARERLWPATENGHPLRIEPFTRAADLPRSSVERAEAETELARRVGVELARLFYTSERTPVRDR